MWDTWLFTQCSPTQTGTLWRRPATFEGGENLRKSSHVEGAKSFLTSSLLTAALSGAMMSEVDQDKSVSLVPIYFLSHAPLHLWSSHVAPMKMRRSRRKCKSESSDAAEIRSRINTEAKEDKSPR